MGYHCDPKGPPGPQAVTNGIEKFIDFAVHHFGIAKENILVGFKKEPPAVEAYEMYINYAGGAAEIWIKENGNWINWSYLER